MNCFNFTIKIVGVPTYVQRWNWLARVPRKPLRVRLDWQDRFDIKIKLFKKTFDKKSKTQNVKFTFFENNVLTFCVFKGKCADAPKSKNVGMSCQEDTDCATTDVRFFYSRRKNLNFGLNFHEKRNFRYDFDCFVSFLTSHLYHFEIK